MKRFILVAAILAATAGLGASSAAATNECRGLQVCVRVAGPWVVVPSALTSPRPRVDFQLSCPRGYVVGGLDAELSDRALDVDFLGKLGSPVNPGVTTSNAALFRRRTPELRPEARRSGRISAVCRPRVAGQARFRSEGPGHSRRASRRSRGSAPCASIPVSCGPWRRARQVSG